MKPYRGGAAQIRASVGVAAARVCLYKSQKEANDARDYFVLPHQYTKIFSHETERIGDHLWQLMVALFLFAKEKKKNQFFLFLLMATLPEPKGNTGKTHTRRVFLLGWSFTSCFIIHLHSIFLSHILGERKKNTHFKPPAFCLGCAQLFASWLKSSLNVFPLCDSVCVLFLTHILLLYRCSVWHLLYS